MTTFFRVFAATGLLAASFAAADAKVYRHTYYAPNQDRTVTLANPELLPLNLKSNTLSTAFKLTAKSRVAITISASCAIGTPGVLTNDVKLYLKVVVDGQPMPNGVGYGICHGDETPAIDNPEFMSLTVAKTLPAGLHTLQLIPNPQPLLGTGTGYSISDLSVVVMD